MKKSILLVALLILSYQLNAQTLSQIKQLSPDAVPFVLTENLLVYPAIDNDVASARVVAGDTVWVVIVATRHHYGVATSDRGFLGYASRSDIEVHISDSANIMRTNRPFPRIDTTTPEGYYQFLTFKQPQHLSESDMQFMHMMDHKQKSKDIRTIRHTMVYFATLATIGIIISIATVASASSN